MCVAHVCVFATCVQLLSRVQLFAISWTVAHQAPLFKISRQQYWRGLLFPISGNLPDPAIKPVSFESQGLDSFATVPPGKPIRFGPSFETHCSNFCLSQDQGLFS